MAFEEELPELEPPASFDELSAPFCGCDTCVIREVLDAAWPHILAVGDALVDENRYLRAQRDRWKAQANG